MKKFLAVIMLLGFSQLYAGAPVLKDIKDVMKNNANGVLTTIGDSVIIKGIVQSNNMVYYFFNQMVSIKDSTGSINILYQAGGGGGGGGNMSLNGLKPGDSVQVTGVMFQLFYRTGGPGGKTDTTGLTTVRISRNTVVKVISGGNAFSPKKVKKLKEKWEDAYVELDSFKLKNPSQWKLGQFNSPAWVAVENMNNSSDTFYMYVSGNIINNMSTPKGGFIVRGIQMQDDGLVTPGSPLTDGYFLYLRDTSDINLYIKPVVLNHKISEIKSYNATTYVPDSIGTKCILKGIVQSTNYAISVAGGFGGGVNKGTIFSIFDNTGSILVVHDQSKFGYDPAPGDSVTIKGTISQPISGGFGGGTIYSATTIIRPEDIQYTTSGNTTLAPKIVTTLTEDDESKLVEFKNVYLKNPSQWDTTLTNNKLRIYVTITDGTDSATVRIGRLDTGSAYYAPRPDGVFNIIGIEDQNDVTNPFTGSYLLMPRFKSDIIPLIKFSPIKDVKVNDTKTGDNLSVGKKVYLQGTLHSEDFLTTGEHYFSIADKTGAIMVYSSTQISYTAKVGDNVKVKGSIRQTNGQTYIDADSIGLLTKGNKTWIQNTITSRALDEADESYLVEVKGLTLIDTLEWDKKKSTYLVDVKGYNARAFDGFADTFNIFVADATDLWGQPYPKAPFNAYGIVIQDDGTSPYNTDYYLLPRSIYDIEASNYKVGIEEKAISFNISAYPNPAKDILNLKLTLTNSTDGNIQVMDVTGKTVINQQHHFAAGNNNVILNTSSLTKGVYLTKVIMTDGSQSIIKFIK